MDCKYYLYRHIRLDKNEPFYIGIGTKNIDCISFKSVYRRAFSQKRSNKFWKNIISKTEYEVEILLESDDYEFIKKREIEFIALYGRRDLGTGILVNLTDGGEGTIGVIVSEEKRQKLREANIGKKASEETKQKLRDSNKNRVRNYPWSKKVINYVTLEIFNSIKEASVKNGIAENTLRKRLKNITTNITTLCFLEEYEKGVVDFSKKELQGKR